MQCNKYAYLHVSDTMHCYSDPCVNNGTCVETQLSYYCICPPEWTGKDCQSKNEINKTFSKPAHLSNGA